MYLGSLLLKNLNDFVFNDFMRQQHDEMSELDDLSFKSARPAMPNTTLVESPTKVVKITRLCSSKGIVTETDVAKAFVVKCTNSGYHFLQKSFFLVLRKMVC